MEAAGWVWRRGRRPAGVVVASVGLVAAAALTGPAPASAAVDPLQALVDAAPDGATIDVPPGEYQGPIDLGGKALHLRGPEVDPYGLDNEAEAVLIVEGGGPGLLVSGGSTIEHLRFEVRALDQPAIRTEAGHAGDVVVRAASFFGSSNDACCTAPLIDAVDGGPALTVERSQFLEFGDLGAVRSAVPTAFVNNAVLAFGDGPGIVLTGQAGEAHSVVNNLFEYVGVGIDASAAADVVVRNNMILDVAVGVVMNGATVVDHNLVDAPVEFVGGTPGAGNLIDLPPGSFTGNLFASGSPGIDRGSALGAPDVDYFGTARPLDGDDDGVAAVDIGPIENLPLGGFHAVQPFRLFDSREGDVPRLGPTSAFLFTPLGKGAIPPSGVRAVVLNVTGVFPTAPTHLSVMPGIPIPVDELPDATRIGFSGGSTSNVNLPAGSVVPNLVTVELNRQGRILVSNNAGDVDVVADVVGWYDDGSAAPAATGATARAGTSAAPMIPADVRDRIASGLGADADARGALDRWVARTTAPVPPASPAAAPTDAGAALHALAPARLLDTRAGLGAPKARVGAGKKVDLQVTGTAGVPATGVSAVVLNVTGVFPTVPTHVTAWPAGTAKPLASNLNLVPGQAAANLVTVKVGATGAVSLGNHAGQVDLLADVVGWYDTGGGVGGHFAGAGPTRLYDTRGEEMYPYPAVTPLGPGEERVIDVTLLSSSLGDGAPELADTVVLNVTGIAGAPTHLTVWPEGPVPATSSLNLAAGETRANLVVVGVGPDHTVRIRNNSGWTHVIVDLFGWFTAPQ